VNGQTIEPGNVPGRIANLAKFDDGATAAGQYGISHTRGRPTGKLLTKTPIPFDQKRQDRAGSQWSDRKIRRAARTTRARRWTQITSDTDTEVLAHLIAAIQTTDGKDSQSTAGKRNPGGAETGHRHLCIALVHADIKDFLVGARRGSPLVLGSGKDENFSPVTSVQSWPTPATPFYLNDFDIVAVSQDTFENQLGRRRTGGYQISRVEFGAEDVNRGEFPHYMLKEIFEQPDSVRDACRSSQYRRMHGKLGEIEHDGGPTSRCYSDRSDRLWDGAARRLGGRILDRASRQASVEVEYASESGTAIPR